MNKGLRGSSGWARCLFLGGKGILMRHQCPLNAVAFGIGTRAESEDWQCFLSAWRVALMMIQT